MSTIRQNNELLFELPSSIKNRTDFVTEYEMGECIEQVAERYNMDLNGMHELYSNNIRERKSSPTLNNGRVVHNLPFVDSETFIKLLIDFIVYKDLTESGDPEQLKSKLPLTSAGDVYFFNPEQQPKV